MSAAHHELLSADALDAVVRLLFELDEDPGGPSRCGDNCRRDGGWLEDPDAWQWEPMGLLRIGVFLGGVALVAGAVSRSGRTGRAALLVGVACWAGLGALALTGPKGCPPGGGSATATDAVLGATVRLPGRERCSAARSGRVL